MSFPNCLLSSVYGIVASKHPCAIPIICAPIPIRPSFNNPAAYLYPCPNCPKILFSGTLIHEINKDCEN